MIEGHRFNSEWWGESVGVVTDASFFALPKGERDDALARFAWVEYNAAPSVAAPLRDIARADFTHVDTQLNFRLGLTRVEPSPSLNELAVEWADESPFLVESADLADFEHERFLQLPGATSERINDRYARWSTNLILEQPAACLRVLRDSEVEGWFFSRRSERGLNLTLAMLHRTARISGMLVYHKAICEYANRGERMGWASFSVTNTAVHNIYVSLGARFLEPSLCWLWVREG